MLALEQLHSVLVFAVLLGSGLIAGAFFTFSTFVMKALARLLPAEGMVAMQSINITVLNPWFLGVFFGTAVVSALLLVWSLFHVGQADSVYLITGSLLYLIGCFMVTGIFNVPRNEVLAKLDVSTAASERLWHKYVDEWTSWNHVRTIASLMAAACFALALQL